MEPKVCGPFDLVKLQTHAGTLNPPNLGFLNRQGMGLVWENQSNSQLCSFGKGLGTFDRTTEHREVHHGSFRDHLCVGEHHGVGDGKQDAVMMSLVTAYRFHGGPV
jgi:hypothetical protein